MVSRSTASRALTGNGYVAPAVRERVHQAAADLGYVPDATARHLRKRASNSVGVLLSDLRNDFYASLADGVNQQAQANQYTMMLSAGAASPEAESEAAEAFVALRVAGVIVTPVSATISTLLIRHQIPVVEVDRQFAAGTCDAVVANNLGAAQRVTTDLIALGHRRIALVIDETDWTTGRDRLAGYQAGHAEAGLPLDAKLQVTAGWDMQDARREALRLLRLADPPTAIFAANNVLAEGVWRAAADLGMRIPGDLSLVSFDDVPWMSMVEPGITAVAQDVAAMGAIAFRLLLERSANPQAPAQTVMLSPSVERRGSTAPPGGVDVRA